MLWVTASKVHSNTRVHLKRVMSEKGAVWPELAKIRHFGKFLKVIAMRFTYFIDVCQNSEPTEAIIFLQFGKVLLLWEPKYFLKSSHLVSLERRNVLSTFIILGGCKIMTMTGFFHLKRCKTCVSIKTDRVIQQVTML